MNFLSDDKAKEILSQNNCEIINNPHNNNHSIFSKWHTKQKLITVVTPVYNCEKFIDRTIQSVIKQSIGFKNIQLIIIDDCSTDNTREIVLKYTKKHKNICAVFLKENTGTPGTPRNIGIELAATKYITFLDGDDHLDPKGLKVLYDILEETNDDFAIGRTIKEETDSRGIIGEFYSHSEKRSVDPFDIPLIFYHLGPTARMMKLSLIKENKIRFPEMKFAEDKTFFFGVLLNAKNISITTKPIYYANRTNENSNSLTKVTNFFEKRNSDLKVIHYLKSLKLPAEKEKIVLNRIYEYDFIKKFDSKLFVKSKNKKPFINSLKLAIETTNDLKYDFRDQIKNPLYRTAIDLFLENRINDFIRFFEWLKLDPNKKYIIKNGLPYYEIPFLENKYKYVRIPMLARAVDSYIIDNIYYQTVEIYGDFLDKIDCIIIRDRKNAENELKFDFDLSGNLLQFKVDLNSLKSIGNGLFTFFIRYNNYELLNLKRILKNQINYYDKKIEFYTTIANNLGLSIKPIEKSNPPE